MCTHPVCTFGHTCSENKCICQVVDLIFSAVLCFEMLVGFLNFINLLKLFSVSVIFQATVGITHF